MLTIAIVFYAAAVVLGVILTILKGPIIVVFGLAGLISGYFYTAPPIRFAHHGLGEIVVGLNFGFLIGIGTYYVQAGAVSRAAKCAPLCYSLSRRLFSYRRRRPDGTFPLLRPAWTRATTDNGSRYTPRAELLQLSEETGAGERGCDFEPRPDRHSPGGWISTRRLIPASMQGIRSILDTELAADAFDALYYIFMRIDDMECIEILR